LPPPPLNSQAAELLAHRSFGVIPLETPLKLQGKTKSRLIKKLLNATRRVDKIQKLVLGA
jgi:hypothetical protein